MFGAAKCWYKKGVFHRDEIDSKTGLSLPAIDWGKGSIEWYIKGKLHKLDGPARQYNDGRKSWYINNQEIKEEDFYNHPLVIIHQEKMKLEKNISISASNDNAQHKKMKL